MEARAPPGQSRESKGLAAVKAKGERWTSNHEAHSCSVEGPLVAGSQLRRDLQTRPHIQAGESTIHYSPTNFTTANLHLHQLAPTRTATTGSRWTKGPSAIPRPFFQKHQIALRCQERSC
jgi:hypothetical protein